VGPLGPLGPFFFFFFGCSGLGFVPTWTMRGSPRYDEYQLLSYSSAPPAV
jgi:hypothetical protein